MLYVSTRGEAPAATLAEALGRGLAPDGGLYVPQRWPDASPAAVAGESQPPLATTAERLLAPFLGDLPGDLPGDPSGGEGWSRLLADALDFPIPLSPLGPPGAPPAFMLELFHGPTLAFKDVGARFLARALPRLAGGGPGGGAGDGAGDLTVLVATSGDTGGAVAQAFWGVAGTRVVVLYPVGQVTPRQERQFATLGGNVLALAVDGTFDDCQKLVKLAFADDELARRLRLTSANSISLGRLLPQTVYYAHAVAGLAAAGIAQSAVFVVPSGNFGNLCAGLMAARLGVPVHRFVAATNANDVVPEYLSTGRYRPRPSQVTLANAMDVGAPSNLERIRWLFGDDLEALRRAVWASSHSDEEIRAAIASADRELGRVLDPHTAVGWLALERFRRDTGWDGPAIVLATAHPAKFAEVVEPILGRTLPLPEALAACLERPLLRREIAADLASLRAALRMC